MFGIFGRKNTPAAAEAAEPLATIVVIGSTLREGATPRDLDVFTSKEVYVPEWQQWEGRLTPRDEKEVAAWAWGRGIPRLRLDVHGSMELGRRGRELVIPVPWGTEPLYEVVQQGVATVRPKWANGIASALRGEAQVPGAFENWRAQAKGVSIHLGHGDKYPRHCSTGEDPWEGVTAIANAVRHLPEGTGERMIRSLPSGEVIMAAVHQGPQSFVEKFDAPWLRIEF